MQREKQKKRKADEKRKRRLERKTGNGVVESDSNPGESGTDLVDAPEQDTVEAEIANAPIKSDD